MSDTELGGSGSRLSGDDRPTEACPEYDVFLSHRGKDPLTGSDTKRGFVSFLQSRLEAAGIRVFVDESELQPGSKAWPVMQSTLRGCKIAVPILHESYGNSTWCLQELAIMMEDREPKRAVLPVFLSDEGTGVLQQLKAGVEKLFSSGKATAEQAATWKAAIGKVGSITGWRLDQTNGFQATLVHKIVEGVLKELGRPLLKVAVHPVAIEERLEPLREALQDKGVVGVYGMGGIGKSTLARAMFNELQPQYAGCCSFLEVGQGKSGEALQKLQQQALKDLCGYKITFSSVAQGIATMEARLRAVRGLVVIDDIWQEEQLAALLVPMGAGSRILVTTRNSDLLRVPLMKGSMLEVNLLGDSESLELFCWHAFLHSTPPQQWSAWAKKAAAACKGLPLTLEVVGSFLWQRSEEIQWEDALERLNKAEKLRGGEQDRLFARLQLSYDDLDPPLKEMFIDTACILLGIRVDRALAAWGRGSRQRLELLQQQSLLEVQQEQFADDGFLVLSMHDQLRDIGRAIANDKRKEHYGWHAWEDASAQSILCDAEMNLNTSIQGVKAATVKLTRAHIENMPNMRLLVSGSMHLAHRGGWLQSWRTNPPSWGLRFLQTRMATIRLRILLPNLAVLVIHNRDLKTLDIPHQVAESMTSLTELCLDYCADLKVLPKSIGKLTNLQRLSLSFCSSLRALPYSIGELSRLHTLDLSWCESLRALPREVGKLSSLQMLNLNGCFSLKALPEELCLLPGLRSNLQDLDLSFCTSLEKLPQSLWQLSSLTRIDLSGCSSLKELPKSLQQLTRLRSLVLDLCDSL